MFNDTYIACFEYGEFYYVLESIYCIEVITDYDDVFYCEIYLN